MIKKLVQMGHNVNSQDARGNSILHHIYENYNDCLHAEVEVLNWLLNNGYVTCP